MTKLGVSPLGLSQRRGVVRWRVVYGDLGPPRALHEKGQVAVGSLVTGIPFPVRLHMPS